MTSPARLDRDERGRWPAPPWPAEPGLAPGSEAGGELQRLLGNQRVQRRLARLGQAPEAPEAAGIPGRAGVAALLQPDGALAVPDGGLHKQDFLLLLEAEVTRGAEKELRGSGRTVEGCPWVAYWLRYYERRDADHLARAIERYAPEAAAARNAGEVVALVTARVRAGVRRSLAVGRLEDLPPGIPVEAFEPGSPVPAGEPLTDPFGLTPEPGREAGAERTAGDSGLGLGEGRPLEGAARTRMEGAFATDLTDVRLHTDAAGQTAAGRAGARAFAYGTDIAVAPGNHAPGTPFGDALLAHEIAHVLQQRPAAKAQPSRTGMVTANPVSGEPAPFTPVPTASTNTASEAPLESDANRAAAGAMASLWNGGGPGVAATGAQARPALGSALRVSRCGPSDDPTVAKTVEVKPIKFFESTGDPDADVAFGNTTVFNQANMQLDKQAEEEFDETQTEEILGPDHTLDTRRAGRTGEESRLISALGSDTIIPIVYVKEVEAPPGGTGLTGEQIGNCGGTTVIAVENGIHSQTVSHELGHALGLGHREGDENNLMHPSAGGHKTQLDPDQITTMRTSRFAQ